MPNEKVLQALASAKTVEEIQSVLDSEGAELVYSGEAKSGGDEFGGKPSGDPPVEVEVELAPGGGMDDEGAEPESFGDFSKKALKKNMSKMSEKMKQGEANGG